jgi:hypothetical protein
MIYYDAGIRALDGAHAVFLFHHMYYLTRPYLMYIYPHARFLDFVYYHLSRPV